MFQPQEDDQAHWCMQWASKQAGKQALIHQLDMPHELDSTHSLDIAHGVSLYQSISVSENWCKQ